MVPGRTLRRSRVKSPGDGGQRQVGAGRDVVDDGAALFLRWPRSWWACARFVLSAAVVGTAVLVVDYAIAFYTAAKLVPVLMVSLAAGLGVDFQEPVAEPVVIVWGVSSGVLAVFATVFALLVMRAAWRLGRRVMVLVGGRWSW